MEKEERPTKDNIRKKISELRAMVYATMTFDNESRELGRNSAWYTEEVDGAGNLVEYKWSKLYDELCYAERLSDSVIEAKEILNTELSNSLREICKDPKIYRLFTEAEENSEWKNERRYKKCQKESW